MTTDQLTAKLTTLEEQLQQSIARRTQLEEAFTQTDDAVKRLEGACNVLRQLLATNGTAPDEP